MHRTQSQNIQEALTINPAQASQRKYPSELIDLWCTSLPPDLSAIPVLDTETGKTLEFWQLCNHPKYKEIWNTSYFNELDRLCQCVGHGTVWPQQQRVKRTNTFRVIQYENIPVHEQIYSCHTRVVRNVRHGKEDPSQTRITVNGGNINYNGDVATTTRYLELFKLMINGVLSRPGAKLECFDVKNFNIDTPLEEPECTQVKLTVIPQEFLDK